jgi:hypothetical protein
MNKLLLCTDLDRTLIPNGPQTESPGARALFSRFVDQDGIDLVYVSGRHLSLIENAIQTFALPTPDYILADVGSTIYRFEQSAWQQWSAWSETIAADWNGFSALDLADMLAGVAGLVPQESEKQNTHKLSYYLSQGHEHVATVHEITGIFVAANVHANVIYSVDETKDIGLIDILPASANKRHAIDFLMHHEGFDARHTIFAGDSGNDLDVLMSPIQSVLVANSTDEVRQALQDGAPENLYIAKGGFLNMNGCYSAGILEGVVHFLPEFGPQIESLS